MVPIADSKRIFFRVLFTQAQLHILFHRRHFNVYSFSTHYAYSFRTIGDRSTSVAGVGFVV